MRVIIGRPAYDADTKRAITTRRRAATAAPSIHQSQTRSFASSERDVRQAIQPHSAIAIVPSGDSANAAPAAMAPGTADRAMRAIGEPIGASKLSAASGIDLFVGRPFQGRRRGPARRRQGYGGSAVALAEAEKARATAVSHKREGHVR